MANATSSKKPAARAKKNAAAPAPVRPPVAAKGSTKKKPTGFGLNKAAD